ncbi:MarR family winged helix-turn-helix transcriptional regulator [Asticcacaulis sp. 201]|uniref:MarR family winged helix-turn-helix transcriptional regulator n=1 Tax=Asticcacaulis sp. 201 TaxID=3028787 RepID=UPI0029162FE7|nr:MarR family winged helix-turn-helix transcriptional regulator [Asticcacaulis sp. 201]MDV6332091.1 MarR family winged helix-turn-helix transcriptional regulator [Asticcacaulis sp. 201]
MKKSKHGDKVMSKNGLDTSPSHLLHRVLQIALDIYSEEAGEGALSQRQYAVLKALEGSEGLSQTDLVRLTGIDRSTLADLVSRMLAKELVARERSVTDARANLVQIAPSGKAALAEMEPRVAAADEKILSLLSAPKRDSFVKLLRKLTAAREEALSGEIKPRKDTVADGEKPIKEKKGGKKKDKVSGKKMKKLPFPPLSEGVSEAATTEELVHAPVVKAVSV